MFGSSYNGWLGTSYFFFDAREAGGWFSSFFVFQAMYCSTAVTIISGAIAERTRFYCYILIAALVFRRQLLVPNSPYDHKFGETL